MATGTVPSGTEKCQPTIDEPVAPISASSRAAALLGDVDSGSLDDYAHLDQTAEDKEDDHEQHA